MTQRFNEVRKLIHQILNLCDDRPEKLNEEESAAYYELVAEYNHLELADWNRGNQFGYFN